MNSSQRPHLAPCEHPRDRQRTRHGERVTAADRVKAVGLRPPAPSAAAKSRYAPRWTWRRARGFTLIELTVVILILAILAAVVTVRLDGPAARARMSDAVDRLAAMDTLARTLAQVRDVPLRLIMDLSEDTLRATDAAGRDDVASACALPGNFRIGAVRTSGGERTAGRVDIPVSPLGLAPTYAVQLEGPGHRKQWILVAGLSGERVEIDETELRAFFEPPQARRNAG